MLHLLFVIAAISSMVLSDCVTSVRSTGMGTIVAYRYFTTNNTLAIIDNRNHFFVFNPDGSIRYKEDLNLPVEAATGRKVSILRAVIGYANELYIVSNFGPSYRYSGGAVVASTTGSGYSGKVFMTFVNTLANSPVTIWQNRVFFYSVFSGVGHIQQSAFFNQPDYLNQSLIARVSGNTFISDIVFCTSSNYLVLV